jgi:hypothetical protein
LIPTTHPDGRHCRPHLSAFERDRRAILAIAGTYRASFDFLEIAIFKTAKSRDQPYQSWGTERVFVDRDDGKSTSLVHLLEMRLIGQDGTVSEPMVSKHWREDWRYQPTQIVEFKGSGHWQRRAVPRLERTGAWSQTVEQADESPRYASTGHWEHTAREYGVARYERLRDTDFTAAQQYYDKTRQFWNEVSAAWDDVFRNHGGVTLHEMKAADSASATLFDYADQLAHGETPSTPSSAVIRRVLRDSGAPVPRG